jgi:glycosyltransferase involved in cell wall biosynthesis
MIKIVLITPILQHYRLSFYEKLSIINNDYQLVVFHGIKNAEDGRPGYIGDTKFANKGFRVVKFKIYPFVLVYNLGMYSEIKKLKPDILIIQGIPGDITYRRIISWARKGRKIIIIWGGGWDPGIATGFRLNFKNKLVSSFFKKASYFLTYSTNNSKYVESMGIDNSIIKTCFNGIETDDLINNTPETIKKSKEIIKKFHLENHITFLYVGGLITEKKVDLLIDAFIELRKKYVKIKLIIIGDGPQKGLIENKLKSFNDPNILFLGRIIEDVNSFFTASDCLVLPGAGGLALNQAMFFY